MKQLTSSIIFMAIAQIKKKDQYTVHTPSAQAYTHTYLNLK
jgi:hypothetical protein